MGKQQRGKRDRRAGKKFRRKWSGTEERKRDMFGKGKRPVRGSDREENDDN